MAETSFFWDGILIGDHGYYNDAQFSTLISSIFQSHRTTQSVIKGSLGELLVTNPSGLTVRMASGRALIDGKPYTNTSNKDFVLTTPCAGKHYYTLVLRKDFSAQTVRAIMLGPDIFAPPVVTQSDGSVWEVSIATISVSSNEIVIITDTRVFCAIPMQLTTGRIVDANITHNKIADLTIDYSKLSMDIFPYATVGDIAYNSAVPGILSAVSPGAVNNVLASGGVGADPLFRSNSAAGIIQSIIAEEVLAYTIQYPVMETTVYDNSPWGGFVTGADTLKVPVGGEGMYLISGIVGWEAGASGSVLADILIGGTPKGIASLETFAGDTTVDIVHQTFSGLRYLQDGNEVFLRVYNITPTALDLTIKSLAIVRIG
jgi:hypothetical protein